MKVAVHDVSGQLVLLTETEYETLVRYTNGQDIKEVAAAMNVSYRTAQNYLYNLSRKLELPGNNRALLTQLALARGCIDNQFL